jgi:hypothetical protein
MIEAGAILAVTFFVSSLMAAIAALLSQLYLHPYFIVIEIFIMSVKVSSLKK